MSRLLLIVVLLIVVLVCGLLAATVASTSAQASVLLGGTLPNGAGAEPSLSADGKFVAYRSEASNLVSSDTNGVGDVFVSDP